MHAASFPRSRKEGDLKELADLLTTTGNSRYLVAHKLWPCAAGTISYMHSAEHPMGSELCMSRAYSSICQACFGGTCFAGCSRNLWASGVLSCWTRPYSNRMLAVFGLSRTCQMTGAAEASKTLARLHLHECSIQIRLCCWRILNLERRGLRDLDLGVQSAGLFGTPDASATFTVRCWKPAL